MLPKSKRYTKEDFITTRPRIFSRGELFDMAYSLLPQQKYTCVVAKKTLKKAVDRNRVKRVILAIMRNNPANKKYSIICYPKKTALSTPYSHLEEKIIEAFATLQ